MFWADMHGSYNVVKHDLKLKDSGFEVQGESGGGGVGCGLLIVDCGSRGEDRGWMIEDRRWSKALMGHFVPFDCLRFTITTQIANEGPLRFYLVPEFCTQNSLQRKKNRDERRFEEFGGYIETHRIGDMVLFGKMNEDHAFKSFFRCGSLFVAKFRWLLFGHNFLYAD